LKFEQRRLAAGPVEAALDERTACVVVLQPSFLVAIHDLSGLAERVHAAGALLVVVVAEANALGLLKSPGAWQADIAVAEGQSLGVPMQFGGPSVGMMATRTRFVRQLPGRIAGATTDAVGRRGFVLTLQAREQHIRREKATSMGCPEFRGGAKLASRYGTHQCTRPR
jgi:glycine dehydrogenase subunit 1